MEELPKPEEHLTVRKWIRRLGHEAVDSFQHWWSIKPDSKGENAADLLAYGAEQEFHSGPYSED